MKDVRWMVMFGWLCGLALLGCVAPGCASYSQKIDQARVAVATSQPQQAVANINERLEVDRAEHLPADLEEDQALLLLERATMLQAMGRYDLAARDMVVADQRLDWLDLSSGDAEQIGRYLYSDDATSYRAPPYERLLLNTLNMINFLAQRDLSGARVEARRFTIMESFYLDEEGRAELPGLLGLGNYLAGATFEASLEYSHAARYYSRAWHFGVRTQDLRQRLLDLYRLTAFQPRGLPDAALARLSEEAAEAGPIGLQDYQERWQRGDTLVIVQTGMVPYKEAVRMPVGSALQVTHHAGHGYQMTPGDRAFVRSMAAQGTLTHINFPQLSRRGLPPQVASRSGARATVRVGDQALALYPGMDVAEQVERAWSKLQGPLVASALLRMVTRAVAGEVTRQATTAGVAGGAKGSAGAAQALGLLAGLAVQGSMAAADTPDTRSWSTLPAQIHLARLQLPRGMQVVEMNLGGRRDAQTVGIHTEGLNVVNFSRLR